MKFDLKHFKKISEDKNSAVLKHPSGHKITISKNVISPDLKKQLSDLPMHLAEGTPTNVIPSNEELQQEAAQLNNHEDKTNLQNEAMRSNAGYPTDFPDVKPVQTASQAPTVVINNGPPQAEQPAQSPAQPDYFTNGTFDTNKFIIASPHAPIESKIRALRQMDEMDKNKQTFVDQASKDEQAKAQQAMQYNQLAARRGLPTVDVPQTTNNLVADASQQSMPQSSLQAPIMPAQMSPQMQTDPYGSQAYSDTMNQGISNVKEGIQKGAEAEGKLGQQQAEIYGNQVSQQQQAAKGYQDHYNELESERAAFQNDIKNQHIDPKRFMNSMGVGDKISTAIGLILGGAGAGLTHTDNPVLSMLQTKIQQDIDSQKANLGKSENLLTANYRQFGNLRDATQMTQIMQADIVKNQIAQKAAQSQDPIVAARAQQAIGEIDTKNAAILSQIAIRKSLAGGTSDPSTKLRMLSLSGIIPEGQQQPAYKELTEAQDTMRAKDNILGAFEQLEKINTVGGAITSPFQTPKQVDAIKKPIVAALSKGTAGRFTEADAGYLESIFPAKGDNPETISIKRNRLDKLISEKMNFPLLQSYGINLGNQSSTGRFGDGGQKKIQLGAPVATSPSRSAQ